MIISQYMTGDHKACDQSFVNFENRLSSNDWAAIASNWRKFVAQFEHHLGMEEQVLFPAFEQATGMTQGPTAVMRSEHAQMRALIGEIDLAIEGQDVEQCQGVAETLMLMMQQHNMKEEQMLYPMTDMRTKADEVLAAMQSL